MTETAAAIVAAHRAGTFVARANRGAQLSSGFARTTIPPSSSACATRQQALAEAEQLAARDAAQLPLYGVPVAVKDNIDVAGMPTTAACPAFAYTPARDATAVARLRAAGAIVIGKTNLDQFATGLVGTRSPYGIPRNPLHADLIPGGSSSGSARCGGGGAGAACARHRYRGQRPGAAMLNNIVGLKPSLGLVSTAGVVPACRTLDCVSVFSLTVDDAVTALSGDGRP